MATKIFIRYSVQGISQYQLGEFRAGSQMEARKLMESLHPNKHINILNMAGPVEKTPDWFK